jgi:hypothetical protein
MTWRSFRPFTPEEDELIKRYFRRRGSKWLTKELGRQRSSIHQRARKLGVVALKHRWEASDDEYLAHHIGLILDVSIARRLRRTVGAVRERARKKGLTHTTNFLSAAEVGRIFGLNAAIIRRWIRLGYLPARKSHVVSCAGKQLWRIDVPDLERFTRRCPRLYDIRRIDKVGYPRIYRLAMKAGADKGVPELYREWSVEEDAALMSHYRQLSNTELGRRLRRTEGAVRDRASVLRRQGYYVPYKGQQRNRKQPVQQAA